MRFHVPQYIEIESKLFGPFTLKQFIYLAGGIGASVGLWFVVPYAVLSLPLIAAVALFSFALAFYKVNEKPFIEVMEAAFYYAVGSKLYIWDRHRKTPTKKEIAEADKKEQEANVPKLSSSKLKDLTWDLDTKTGEKDEDLSDETI
ncbi:MAG: PrgI family protein [Candidatus Paceibacterota bacterium]